MKPTILIFLLFLSSFSPRPNTPSFVIKVDKTTKIIFTEVQYIKNKNDKVDTFYCAPRIIKNSDTLSIGYISDFCGFIEDYSISPNKQNIVLHRIESGWVEEIDLSGQIDSFWHENYFCYFIDVKNNKVLFQSQTDCDGHWNKHNKWIKNE